MQVFEGVHQVYDVFAHQNVEFWSTMMVAYNTTGFISCAGTNFAIRASALRACGMPSIDHAAFFPKDHLLLLPSVPSCIAALFHHH